MIHKANREERRKTLYLHHPAYKWAIDSDWPHSEAKKLVYCLMWELPSNIMEIKMNGRLTFTKFVGVKIYAVTDKAIQVRFKHENARDEAHWIARSNLCSDDDKRMAEVHLQLQSTSSITTAIHIADWLAKKEGWLEQDEEEEE